MPPLLGLRTLRLPCSALFHFDVWLWVGAEGSAFPTTRRGLGYTAEPSLPHLVTQLVQGVGRPVGSRFCATAPPLRSSRAKHNDDALSSGNSQKQALAQPDVLSAVQRELGMRKRKLAPRSK